MEETEIGLPDDVKGLVPTGTAWRRRWADLDDDDRVHIVESVHDGSAVSGLHRAPLAVRFAVAKRREALAAIVLAPPLLVAAVMVGIAAGRHTRGGDAVATLHLMLTSPDALVFAPIAVCGWLLLALATRRWRARLRRAQARNVDLLRDAARSW